MSRSRRDMVPPRPLTVVAILVLLFFLGISAIVGSIAMLVPDWSFPQEWLDDVPLITSWTIPSIVLGVGFGLGSLVTAFGMLRRWEWTWLAGVEKATGRHWSWLATIAIGVGQVIWISLELIFLPEPSPLQAIYGAVGLALATLPWFPSARRCLSANC